MAHGANYGEIMCDENDGESAFFLDPAQQPQDLLAHSAVERRHRLVANQHLWLEYERTGDRDALCLAPRQFVRVAVEKFGTEPGFLEHCRDPLPALFR